MNKKIVPATRSKSPEDAPSGWSADHSPGEILAHPERWPYRHSDGTTRMAVRRPLNTDGRGGVYYEYRWVFSDDPDLATMGADGWEAD